MMMRKRVDPVEMSGRAGNEGQAWHVTPHLYTPEYMSNEVNCFPSLYEVVRITVMMRL